MSEPSARPAEAPAPPPPLRPRARRRLAVAVVIYVAVVFLVWGLLRFYADVWWPATLILFGPRWIWGLPLLGLAPLAIDLDRRLLAPLGLAALVVVIPILGLRFAWPRSPAPESASPGTPPRKLRLMTYNVGEGLSSGDDIFRILNEVSPDVMAIQECGAVARVSHRQPGERYNIIGAGELCLLSRSRIEKIKVLDPEAVRAVGGTGTIVRYVIHLPAGDVSLVQVHLATVREGLGALRAHGLAGVPALEANQRTRSAMSALARAFVDETEGPLLVAGDFNLPIESAIYRRDWSAFPNAFSVAGRGFGDSKQTGFFGIRIDHILLGPGFRCERALVGPHLDGDHRPVIADLTWSG